MEDLQPIQPVLDNYVCIKGEFCGVSYYMTTLNLDKVADSLHFEKELNIQFATFAERVQRKLDEDRAKKEIYEKYLLNEGTRFFNSLVVTIIPDGEDKGFYELEHKGANIYILKLLQNVKKVVVDGQHRLFALRKLREDKIAGKLDNRPDLKDLQIPIVFVLYDKINCKLENNQPIQEEIIKETRRVFTALNKTAKKIDKYTTLIVDDSDFSAVVSRKLLEDNYIDELYVKWAFPSTSLNQDDVYFTNLNIINEMVEFYLQKLNDNLDDEDLSTDDKSNEIIEKYFINIVDEIGVSPKELIVSFFKLSFFNNWKEIITNNSIEIQKQPDKTSLTINQKNEIRTFRNKNILATVVGQRALFNAMIESIVYLGETPKQKMQNIFNRIEKLIEIGLFKKSNDIWKGILVGTDSKGKMITKKQNVDFASDILFLILTFDKFSYKELENKLEELNKHLIEKIGVINKITKLKEIIEEFKEKLNEQTLTN